MEKLIEAGMFGRGLVSVNTPTLVERYNDCLRAIGVAPTKLSEFQIDGIGWSPQVAMERKVVNYFSPGLVGQFGIILTLDQRGLPVYSPFYSFDRVLLEKLFRNAGKQIADITNTSGIWLDFAQDLSTYRSPLDLLTLEDITLRAYDTVGLQDAAKKQRDLIREFRESKTRWADKEFRQKIIESGKEFGDLRFRSIVVPDLPFTDIRSFYTRAFGGIFVLRDFSERPILVLENHHEVTRTESVQLIRISDKNIFELLTGVGVFEIPLSWYKKNVEELEKIRNYGLVSLFYEDKSNADVNFDSLTSAQKKQWIASAGNSLPSWIIEIEKLIAALRANESLKNIELSANLSAVLFQPSKAAKESETVEKTVYQLLARLVPHDIERLFNHNRILFYELYKSWTKGRKIWAVEHLRRLGYPKTPNKKTKN